MVFSHLHAPSCMVHTSSHLRWSSVQQVRVMLQVQNSLALGTSPVVRALFDPEGGMRDVRALDRISFTDWFKSHGGSQGSIDRMWCALDFPAPHSMA